MPSSTEEPKVPVSKLGPALIGMGALCTVGAQAVERGGNIDDRAAEVAARGEVVLRFDGERLLASEGKRPFEAVPLADTPEARRLRELLREETIAVPVGRTIVADGGAGFHGRRPPPKSGSDKGK